MAPSPRTRVFRKFAVPAFSAFVLLFNGAWMLDGPQSTIHVHGPVAESQLNIFYVTLYVTTFIFLAVGGVLAYATFKFRARTRADEHAEPPPQSHGNPLVEIGLIAASVFLLVIIAVPTIRGIWYAYDVPEGRSGEVFELTATGFQWWFKFDYDDHGFTTANELVLPAGRPIRVHLRTVDVIHSFWIPKLAGKVDMIPNRANFIWFKADEPGYYWAQCAEFCGESHSFMKFRVIVLDPEDFEVWLAHQAEEARTVTAENAAPADRPRVQFTGGPRSLGAVGDDPFGIWKELQLPDPGEDPELIARGRELFRSKACLQCHTIRGHGAPGITGPDLTHFGSRTTLAAGHLDNSPENLKRWLIRPNDIKPGNKMWYGGYVVYENDAWREAISVDESEAEALVAYLHSLK